MTQWLTPAQVCDYSGWGIDTVGAALRSGELVGHQRKPNGRWRITVEAVDAWIKGEPYVEHIPSITRRSA